MSNAGVYRWPNVSGYAVSKTAVIKFTENLAVELRNEGVTLFAVHPGIVRTGLTELALDSADPQDSPAGKVAAWFRQEIAAGHDLPPELVAQLVVQLAHGSGDALSGRYIDYNDLTALVARADEISHADLYTLRLR